VNHTGFILSFFYKVRLMMIETEASTQRNLDEKVEERERMKNNE
jgi:hypothetical protein